MKLEIIGDERVGKGGYLHLRRLRLRAVRDDGSRTAEGLWDYVERPMGLDAVVLALWRRRQGRVEVLLRSGVRVPVLFGRPQPPTEPLFPELVAGIVETGDDVGERAAAEALEETGLTIAPADVRPLGPPMYPTPGMCAEVFHFVHSEVAVDAVAVQPAGDGSIFEEGASLEWAVISEALTRCAHGRIRDLKTEIGL
ncbi:MAG TPA: NUDIX domain-containing protein, partial [Myxococcales bacterium]|nr:NUDIX domain-containing protein [Myxococcales bacterium]